VSITFSTSSRAVAFSPVLSFVTWVLVFLVPTPTLVVAVALIAVVVVFRVVLVLIFITFV